MAKFDEALSGLCSNRWRETVTRKSNVCVRLPHLELGNGKAGRDGRRTSKKRVGAAEAAPAGSRSCFELLLDRS
jgi:hypothetical protein